MFVLTDEQVRFILEDIRRNGIVTEELQQDLLDHICCVIEAEMSAESNFEEFYRRILPRFFKRNLREIQEETTLLLTFKNYYAMKKILLISGAFSAITLLIGAFLKLMFYPGAGLLFVIAIGSFSLIFLPLLSILRVREQKENKNKIIIGIAAIFGALICLATLFKVMHWPYANPMWMASLAILFFIFLPVYFFTGIRSSETKTNTIISSVLILTAGGLLFTLTNLRASRWTDESTYASDDRLRVAAAFVSDQNQIVYSTDSISSKRKELQVKTNLICSKIDQLKAGLIQFSSHGKEGLSEPQIIRNYGTSLNFATAFLFDQDGKAKPDLRAIKTELLEFNAFVEKEFSKKPSILLDLNDVFRFGEKDQEIISWEHNNFDNLSVAVTLRNFNQLVLNIRLIEASCR